MRALTLLTLAITLIFMTLGCNDSVEPNEEGDYDVVAADGDSQSDNDAIDDTGETADGDDQDVTDTADGDVTAEDEADAVDGDVTEEALADPDPEPDIVVDGDDDTVDDIDPNVTPACAALVAGTNSNFMVDGAARQFILTLPNTIDSGGPFAVIFNWHGFGDTASNMNGLFSYNVNNTTMPYILVTPEDMNVSPPSGFDWDALKAVEPNREVRLFDEILSCLHQRWDIDDDHIHSAGFSAGSIMTDLLGTMRGDLMASLVTYSGVYWSNPADKASLNALLQGYIGWPEMTTQNHYAQIFLHGGPTDNYNLFVDVIQFNEFAVADAAWLNGLGHDTVVCDHSQANTYVNASDGHTLPSQFRASQIIEFFAAHPRGVTVSPYRTDGLPADFPDFCTFSPATAQ